jgi:hypothetical protein
VSILYALPRDLRELSAMLRPSAVGNYGALFAPASFAALGFNQLDSVNHVGKSGYDNLALVGVRLDPCAPRREGTCAAEVRLVFQPVAQLPESGPEPQALDGGVHVTYEVPQAELRQVAQEVLTLKLANGDRGANTLGPHPILAAQGPTGTFANGLRNILLFHVGEQRISRVTAFDHNFHLDGDGWSFVSFDKLRGRYVPGRIPHVPEGNTQSVGGSAAHGAIALTDTSAFVLSQGVEPDSVAEAVDAGRTETLTIPEGRARFEQAVANATKVQDPRVHHVETTGCANCHLAEGATALGRAYGVAMTGFGHTRSTARLDQRVSVTNLHAFGYLGREVAVMQRTANETAIAAETLSRALLGK